MPHLDAAYNLARWLTHSDHDAQDVVQEACLRAFRGYKGFSGVDARAWLLMIVRNASFDSLKRSGRAAHLELADESAAVDPRSCDPAILLQRAGDSELVRQAIEKLPAEYREVIVLREMQGLSYKSIAEITGSPMGTVMSRLSRGRRMLQEILAPDYPGPAEGNATGGATWNASKHAD